MIRIGSALLIGLLTMAITTIYGPQAWTAGTFSVATNTSSDANYPEIDYLERVQTRDGQGPSGERIVDTYQANPDYSIGAVSLVNFGPETGGKWDVRGGDGNGTYYDLDVLFGAAVEADSGNFSYAISIGHNSLNMFALRVALTEGKLYVEENGSEVEAGFGAISADDAWHTLRVFLSPSSDDGSTADGIIRVWIKDSTAAASTYSLLFEKTDSFIWSPGDPFLVNRIWLGRFGLLPTTNLHLYYGEEDAVETIRGSFVAGETTTVNVSRAVAFGLDGATNVHSDEGVRKTFGHESVTGYVEQAEMASAPAAAAGTPKKVRIWAEDSGGKTRWMAQFATGSAVQLTIEP